MDTTTSKVKILAAALAGFVLVSAALWLRATGGEDTASAQEAALLSERKYIPVVDSDKDGVPNWQAELIDAEPIYIDETTEEADAEPDTLTEKYAVSFFEDMMVLDTVGLLENNTDELVAGTIAELEAATAAKLYERSDLQNIITTNDPEGLRTYGNLVASLIYLNTDDGATEYETFTRLMEDEDPVRLERLAEIEAQYAALIDALLALEVPSQYVSEHLAVVNSYAELKTTAEHLQLYFDDRFAAFMRYRRMFEDVTNMRNVIVALYNRLNLHGSAQFANDDALFVLVTFIK